MSFVVSMPRDVRSGAPFPEPFEESTSLTRCTSENWYSAKKIPMNETRMMNASAAGSLA